MADQMTPERLKRLSERYTGLSQTEAPVRYRGYWIFKVEGPGEMKWRLVVNPKVGGETLLSGVDYDRHRKHIDTQILFAEFVRDRALFKEWKRGQKGQK